MNNNIYVQTHLYNWMGVTHSSPVSFLSSACVKAPVVKAQGTVVQFKRGNSGSSKTRKKRRSRCKSRQNNLLLNEDWDHDQSARV